MKRNIVVGMAVVALVVALSSCAAPASTPPNIAASQSPSTSTSPSPTATPTPTLKPAKTNEHGNLVKQVGELAGTSLSQTDKTTTSRFTVTSFQVDPQCTSGFAESPKNGHFLKVNLHVETTPELAQDKYGATLSFSQYGWHAYNSDGTRLNDPIGSAYSCLAASEQLPGQIGPGEVVDGAIILDVRDTTGSVALIMGGSSGWEWSY